MSLVETHRKDLEKCGDYVIRANASTGWFAVFPKKLDECRSKARAQARSVFHIVVYRTTTGDERDHWSIPFSVVAQEFTENSLTHSKVNNVDRWNCTFRNGVLHVTHTGRDIDVSQFYRAPLFIEIGKSDASLPEEILEEEIFSEGSVTRISVNRYERDADARSRCIALYGAKCAICRFDFSVVYGPTMLGFIHVHHLIPLHQIRGSYVVNPKTDLIPVCPNCHAVIHSRREPLTVEQVRRLIITTSKPDGPPNVPLSGRCRSSA